MVSLRIPGAREVRVQECGFGLALFPRVWALLCEGARGGTPGEASCRGCRLGRLVTAPGDAQDKTKKFEGPVSIERSFKVDGKKLTVMVTFPAAVVQELGMEPLLVAANRAIVSIETKNHAVDKFR